MNESEEKSVGGAEARTNWIAITGFIFGIASIPLCMMILIPALGILLSSIGLATAKRYRPWGRVLAFIGLVVSSICLLVTIISGK